MIATPMNKTAFLASYFVTRISLSIIEMLFLLFFSWWYFGITVQGSIPALVSMLIAGNIVFFGLAILLSSRTSNTQIANGIINAVSMPMMICSGIFFSYHNFPDWLTAIIRQLPLTLIADSMRSIFTEGAGFAEIKQALLLLCGTGLILFIVGKRIYKWYWYHLTPDDFLVIEISIHYPESTAPSSWKYFMFFTFVVHKAQIAHFFKSYFYFMKWNFRHLYFFVCLDLIVAFYFLSLLHLSNNIIHKSWKHFYARLFFYFS